MKFVSLLDSLTLFWEVWTSAFSVCILRPRATTSYLCMSYITCA